MLDRELAQKNLRMGWALFCLFLVLFAGTFVIAAVYIKLS